MSEDDSSARLKKTKKKNPAETSEEEELKVRTKGKQMRKRGSGRRDWLREHCGADIGGRDNWGIGRQDGAAES